MSRQLSRIIKNIIVALGFIAGVIVFLSPWGWAA